MPHITTQELRSILKKSGFNSRQVSVKQNSSLTYLTVTIRDAKVTVESIKSVTSQYNTWHMDNTDYVTGQSINVVLSDEVKDMLADAQLDFVTSLATPEDSSGNRVGDLTFWNCDGYVYFTKKGESGSRNGKVSVLDFEMRTPWAIRSLALQSALLNA